MEYLDISDNKILALPAAALARLQILKRLKVTTSQHYVTYFFVCLFDYKFLLIPQVDYNRIGAINNELLSSVPALEELSMAFNILREIPQGTFQALERLKILNLYGNQLSMVETETFGGVEKTLEYLDLGFNMVKKVGEISFPSLKYLNLEKNELKDIDGAFNLLGTLQVG